MHGGANLLSIVRGGPKPTIYGQKCYETGNGHSLYIEKTNEQTYSVSGAVVVDGNLKCGDCIIFHMDSYLELSIFNRFV